MISKSEKKANSEEITDVSGQCSGKLGGEGKRTDVEWKALFTQKISFPLRESRSKQRNFNLIHKKGKHLRINFLLQHNSEEGRRRKRCWFVAITDLNGCEEFALKNPHTKFVFRTNCVPTRFPGSSSSVASQISLLYKWFHWWRLLKLVWLKDDWH